MRQSCIWCSSLRSWPHQSDNSKTFSTLCVSVSLRLPPDVHLQQTTFSPEMNYRHGQIGIKSTHELQIFDLILPFLSTSVLSGVSGKERTGHISRKNESEDDNQTAAASVWLVWYSALITGKTRSIIYTFPSFLCSYRLKHWTLGVQFIIKTSVAAAVAVANCTFERKWA